MFHFALFTVEAKSFRLLPFSFLDKEILIMTVQNNNMSDKKMEDLKGSLNRIWMEDMRHREANKDEKSANGNSKERLILDIPKDFLMAQTS